MISDNDLHAYADGELDPARLAEVEARLAADPAAAQRVALWRRQNEALHALFDGVLTEPVPARLLGRPRPRWPLLRMAAVVAWLAVGGVAGWALRGATPAAAPQGVQLARLAAVAHAVYVPELRHPVEVGADQEQHLVTWLSKRLGAPVKAPRLNELGYGLVGGRLLPAEEGPAAQFMYQDAEGHRLTLYVRTNAGGNRETAFRYARESGVSVFYWVEGSLGYALSADLEREELLRVAQSVYHQLNP
ncbi:MAG TPA: anti-sigma factor [Burkholderiales bacterium]|nr:anti-sigma factor [Burkholderiales bacterium]